MNVENVNYYGDRSTSFKHHVPGNIGGPSAPTVADYVQNEKAKQMSKLRDWYLESKSGDCEPTDLVSLRTSFTNSRKFSAPTPVQEIDHHKHFLIAGALIATVVGTVVLFVHF